MFLHDGFRGGPSVKHTNLRSALFREWKRGSFGTQVLTVFTFFPLGSLYADSIFETVDIYLPQDMK
jgi:hypothetical protein